MLEILDGPDQIGAYKLTGTLTVDDFDRVIADLEARLSRHRKLGLVVDIGGLDDVTVRAMLKDLRYGFGKIFEWNRFPREAIITDKGWLRKLAKLAGLIMPLVQIRTFMPGEEAAAFIWVEQAVPAAEEAPGTA